MRLLVLGGTRFVGRYLVEAALARGHEVTMFNRGQGDAEVFPEVERLVGDRDGKLDALKGRAWDAAVDTCGFYPRIVRQTAELLGGTVRHYTYISSGSVYADLLQERIDESAEVDVIAPEVEEELTREGSGPYYGPEYGALKARCEETLEEVMPGRVLHVRAGLIVGPHDYSDRFTYWPSRVGRGGEVLVPEPRERMVQVIDVRDLGEWMVRMIEEDVTGVFNASGAKYSMEELVNTCKEVSGSDASFTWVSSKFLEKHGVGEWIELPLWIASASGMFDMENGKAFAAGLTTRPLAETCRDTWEWDRTRPHDAGRKAGLRAEREVELLRAWKS